jgi:hypothetical protein
MVDSTGGASGLDSSDFDERDPDFSPQHSSHPVFWTGLYTGALLMMVMIGALVAANRLSWLESRALERNAASFSLFILFMMIPVCRFLKRPLRLFTSGMLGWLIFVVAYNFAGMYFRNLFEVLRTPFQGLVEGAVVYGVIAVGSWVGGMLMQARSHPIAPASRRADEATTHRP